MNKQLQEEFLVDDVKLMCFGAGPVTNLMSLQYYAGGHKFSELCAFKFHSALNRKNPDFEIAFVAKIKSRIGKRAPVNPSQWFIFRKISRTEVEVMDNKTLLLDYYFDIEQFFTSNYFSSISKKFQNTCKTGLNQVVEFANSLSRSEDKLKAEEYISSIEQAIPFITNPKYNKTPYILRDLDN